MASANGKQVRLTEQDDIVISQLYKRGKSLDEIAEFMGCARSTIHNHLKAMGLIVVREKAPKAEESMGLTALVGALKSIDSHLSAIEEALTLMALREDESPLS